MLDSFRHALLDIAVQLCTTALGGEPKKGIDPHQENESLLLGLASAIHMHVLMYSDSIMYWFFLCSRSKLTKSNKGKSNDSQVAG